MAPTQKSFALSLVCPSPEERHCLRSLHRLRRRHPLLGRARIILSDAYDFIEANREE